MSQTRQACYADITNPSLKNAINSHCLSTVQLASLVSEFAREMAAAHEQFALEIQKILCTFRSRSEDLKNKRLVESPSTIFCAWENLMKETEVDAQAHLDAANLLIKNVCEPLHEVAEHKQSQAQKLQMFRDNFQDILNQSEEQYKKKEQGYLESYKIYRNSDILNNRQELRHTFHNAHNDYVLQMRSSNRIIDEFQIAIPQILEELDEIYIDTSNTINVAIESHSLLLLTKANEQQRRFENLLKICRQVNPQLDISYFTKIFSPDEAHKEYALHEFSHSDHVLTTEETVMNHLILDQVTEIILRERRTALQKEGLELAAYIKQNQDITHTLVNICQRNLANHLYAKVYETQEDMCRKRNEVRLANLQLGAVRSQIELLTPKHNGSMDDDEKKNPSTIRGMWKKAFKSLKSSSSEPKLVWNKLFGNCIGKMELEKTKSETKRKKSKPLRKNAIAMTEPLDMSGLHLTVEESTRKKTTVKRTKSDCGLKPEYVDTTERGAIPKKGSHTEKLHRKFKVISSKSNIETDDGSSGSGKETTYQRQRTVTRTMPEATRLPKGSDETVVEIEIHKTVNRIDKDVQLYEDIDVRIQDNVKVRRDMTSIKSNSDVVMNELMADVYKKTNMEKLSFLDPFDSSLNIFDDEIHRSNSFNVTSDLRHHKEIEHSSIPRLGRAYSNASAMTIEDDRFEEIISTKEIIVKRRIHPQSEKLSRKSRCDQLEVEADFHSEIPQNRMRRKSKSEELVQGSHEKFLQALQLGSNRDDCSDEGNFSSSEDLLNTPQWYDRKWKSKELLFSQSSMNSIEENFETPPSTPSFNTTKEGGLFFDKKSKTDQKRKISTGKKIIDKIKNEIVRKISCGEKNPSKMKREKSFERLRKHICEVDKNFQKWIDHVRRIHTKKSSLIKKKQNSKEGDEEPEAETSANLDPVYSLLKCAADLPKSGVKSPCLVHPHCSGHHQPTYNRYPSGGDSSGSTSKTSSPSSSASHSPKTRRKKLNARMKSFSLDAPEPPKQLLGIDESTKKKSSSFTNTCFGVSPDEKVTFSATSLRKKFGLKKASSLEIEERKQRSHTPSPKSSPKSQKKQQVNLFVALYNFKAKEKDDIDLRAGWRVNVTDSSKKDWWKGKTRGKTGYFPATYVIPLQADQRVFQVLQPLNLLDGNNSIKFHKDQIVLQVGDEIDGMITIRAANNRQAMCPLFYLQEL